jgi:6-phosphogluconolactonase
MPIEEFQSAEQLARTAALAVADLLGDGIVARGRASLVATGGRSPGGVYDALSGLQLDWSKVTVTLSDERCVDATAPEANARLVRERLLTGRAAAARFLPLWPEADESEVRTLLPFDAVLLGMGDDGHIASLIPGDPGLAAALDPAGERLLVSVPAGLGAPPLPRVSLTVSALTNARAIFLLIAGEAKRALVGRAEAGEDLPVRRVLAQEKVPVRILWQPQYER